VVAVSLCRNVRVLGVSRNIGMRLTDSDFVAFLDDDNAWYPDHLEVALARLNDRGPAAPHAVYTALRRVLPDGSDYDVLSRSFDRRAAANESFLDTNSFVVRRLPQVMFSRIERPPSVFPREDWEFIYRLGRRFRIEHIPRATVEYTINPDSYWTDWGPASSNGGQAPASA
jgi:glycosyltransferase involved in cell wall biosynthesis